MQSALRNLPRVLGLGAVGLAILACNLEWPSTGAPLATPTTVLPTNTPSPAPTTGPTPSQTNPTASASATATASPTGGPPQPVTVFASGGQLNVRRGPGPEYDPVAAFLDGQSGTATARNADSSWVLISRPDATTTLGWIIVTTPYTTASGGFEGLPVMAVAAAVPAYIRNCTTHEMLVNPNGVTLLDRNSVPDNQVQFYPGEYSVVDLTTDTVVASASVFEGRTIDIRKDGSGSSFNCP